MKRYLAILFFVMLSTLVVFGGRKLSIMELCGKASIEYEMLDESLIRIDADNVDDLLGYLNINNLSKNEVSDREIIEGYSSKLNGYKYIDGFRINIQISVFDDYALVGSPLIDGSF